MSAKPSNRYKGKIRPFLLLSPDEDKASGIAAIHAEITKSEYLRRAVVYCLNNNIDLADLSKNIELKKTFKK